MDTLAVRPRTTSGKRVRFVAPPGDDANYEQRVHSRGEVATRAHNWHDLFNATAWIAFPRLKAVMNDLHVRAMRVEEGRRGRLRDLVTLFDEGGAIVMLAERALEDLVRAHRWRDLFWERRDVVRASMRILVVGHAVLEKAMTPWPGITCKALFLESGELDSTPIEVLVQAADAGAARWFERLSPNAAPERLPPLPIFGYPGWHPDSAHGYFYDDTRYFRPFQRERAR